MSNHECHAGMNRRQMLARTTGAFTTALLGSSMFSSLAHAAAARQTGKKLILLWLQGGPSQFETFDPKPGTTTGGPTKVLPTDVQDWFFAHSFPRLARKAGDLCVIRSMTSKEGNHSRAQEYVKTGYVPNPSVSFPTIGSIVSKELGDPLAELPNFVQINGDPASGGYLGVEYAPLAIGNPEKDIDNVDYARGVSDKRMDHRERMLKVLDDEFHKSGGRQAVDASRTLRDRARRLMDTKLRTAFDLRDEKESLRDQYGRNAFGQGCLLARRLLEKGVPAVEVVLNGWDTHDDNFARVHTLGQTLDPAFATLIDDLKRHGLYDDTVICCMGEFGRTPRITATDGRGHWPASWCATLSGGAFKTGQPLGSTDETGESILERPVTVPDLFATLSKVLGFDPDHEVIVRNRPITLVDPEGKIVREILRSA